MYGIEAIFINAGQKTLVDANKSIGEVDDLFALVGDGDAIGGHIILTVGYGLDHTFPCRFNENRRAIQQFAHRSDGIIIPAGRLAGCGINVVKR